MRILHLVTSLHFGGAERFVCQLSDELSIRGHEVLCAPANGRPHLHPSPTVAVEPLFEVAPRWPLYAPAYLNRIKRTVRSFRPDLIHCHSHHLLVAALPLGVPLCLTVHSTLIPCWHSRRWIDHVYRSAASVALRNKRAILVVLSERSRSAARCALNVPSAAIEVIPNGIPLDSLQAKVDALRTQTNDGAPRIAWVGRLESQKSPHIAIRSAAALRNRGASFHLDMCGDGSLRSEMERLIAAEGLSNLIRMRGWVSDVASILAAAALFWFTSTRDGEGREGHPLALIEAMAAALPIVAADVIGVSDHLSGCPWATLVPSDEPEAFANATLPLLADASGRNALGAAARAAAKPFSISACADRYLAVYDSLTCTHR